MKDERIKLDPAIPEGVCIDVPGEDLILVHPFKDFASNLAEARRILADIDANMEAEYMSEER